jgi:hypothetical protein
MALIGPAFAQSDASVQEQLNRMEKKIDAQNAQIERQQDQIRALRGRRGGATVVTATPAAEPAPQYAPQPEVTAAQFEALQNQVYEQQASTTSTNANGWWNNTKISGRMYFDVTNLDNQNSGVKSAVNGTNFDIKRFYLGIDHQFNSVFSANLTTDFTYDSVSIKSDAVNALGDPATTTVTGSNTSQLYIKKAYLQAKLDDAFIIRLGSADLPWIPFVEDLYGYRYVENTLIDRTKYGTSADWGVHLLGKFDDGIFNYQISAVNGEGYKKIPIGTANRSKGIDLEGRVNVNYDGFTLGVGGYTGKLGHDVENAPTYHTAQRFDAIAAYTDDQFRVGVEYFSARDWNSVTSASPSFDRADGYSGFASWQFDPQWSVFGRYDWVRPKNLADNDFKDNYYNLGISYSPTKIVDFALVYKHETGGDGFIATSNGTIGGLLDAPGSNGKYNEIGLWGQLRW